MLNYHSIYIKAIKKANFSFVFKYIIKGVKTILNNWAVIVSFVSLFALLLGYAKYNASPLHTFEEIGYEQEQAHLKREFVQFHNQLGIKFLYVEEVSAARSEFNQVLKVDPLNQNATKGLFECDLYKDIENSSSDPNNYKPWIIRTKLNELAKEYPNDSIPEFYSGKLASNFGEYYKKTAIEHYNEAIRRDKSNAAAYNGLGIIYENEYNLNKSREFYQEAVNYSDWDTEYRYNLANIYYELKDYGESSNLYAGTVTLDQNYLSQYIGISNSLRCKGDLKFASYYQEKQIELMENNSIVNLNYNNNNIRFHLNSRETINLNTNNEKKLYAYYNMALTYYLLGNETGTLEFLKKANTVDINTDNKKDVKSLLIFDIENLQNTQPNFMNKTIEFRNKVLM
jgi:tetratricopeptide (TPR) repeat protein